MKLHQQIAILNLIAFAAAFLFSMLGQTDIVGQYSMAEISAMHETAITPAGFTFSIWALLYLALAVMTVGHVLIAFRKPENYVVNRELEIMGPLFATNQAAIALWVYFWLNNYVGISLVLILVQLLSLYGIGQRLRLLNPKLGKTSLFLTQFPLSMYFAWITIATLANFAAWIHSLGWLASVSADVYMGYILLLVAIAVGFSTIYFRHNVFFGLVYIWAFYGIVMKRMQIDDTAYSYIVYLCAVGIAVFLLSIIVVVLRFRNIEAKPYQLRKKTSTSNSFKPEENS
ncbi:hypothetical protein [Olivibacter sitiensis]|uniref:hypothetical protein n=1 Tax=Olivibacter sitiensis TaxID=376470 RepID=UPI00041629B3|nr:hypothetical protein [Olivibacter sitiensis]